MRQIFANGYVSILYRYSQRYFAQRLREGRIPVELGQMPCMLRVLREPGLTQEAISAQLGMDKGTVARSLCAMEKAGLILRQEDPGDRRVNHIYPTALAVEIFPTLQRYVTEYQEMLFRDFGPQDREKAMELLRRMRQNVARELAEDLPAEKLSSWEVNRPCSAAD